MAELYQDADEALETLNLGGSCAAIRLLQLRIFGVESVHGAVVGKIRSVAHDGSRALESEYYQLKERCVNALTPQWHVCLHVFKAVRDPDPSQETAELHHGLVFTDATLRCWLVVECDPRLEMASVARARDGAVALRQVLAQLQYPVADIEHFVFAPASSGAELPPAAMRRHLKLSEPPAPMTDRQQRLVAELCATDAAQAVLRKLPREAIAAGNGAMPTKLKPGCDPPIGSVIRMGRTVVPTQQ